MFFHHCTRALLQTHRSNDVWAGTNKFNTGSSQTSAKSAFSLKNPYPGCIPSTFVISAALITAGMSR